MPSGSPNGASATYHAEHQRRRRRLRVLVHPVRMAAPVAAAAAITGVAAPATAVGWLAALRGGPVPPRVAGLVRVAHGYYARVNGSLYLLSEPLPPLAERRADRHPVRLRVVPREGSIARRDLLRRLAAAPAIVATDVALGVGVLVGAGAAAVTIVATGRMPATLHRAIAFGTSYHARSAAYLALVTDVAPRLRERDPRSGRPTSSGSGGV
jgi:hypothetical protein